MSTILFTGFPGFLGSQLLPRVLERAADAEAVCLVQDKFLDLAKERAAELERATPPLTGRIRVVAGDITLPDLGLGALARDLHATTTEVFHLAAVYDLSVPRELAVKVNVDGTRNVIAFATACSDLDRFQYVSTCYVSGRYTGIFSEDDLVMGQRFNNFYEETKYLAELEVQRARDEGLPPTIYRPAVVAGDSATGETQKYDGPYFLLRFLLKQKGIAVVPMVGDPASYRFNFVPRDFVVDAIANLSARKDALNKVYALADPLPATIQQLVEMMATAAGKRLITVPLTRGIAKTMIQRVPGVHQVMQIPAQAVDYFTHPTHYLTTNATRDLAGTGIELPDHREYVQILAEFVRGNPDISSAAMV